MRILNSFSLQIPIIPKILTSYFSLQTKLFFFLIRYTKDKIYTLLIPRSRYKAQGSGSFKMPSRQPLWIICIQQLDVIRFVILWTPSVDLFVSSILDNGISKMVLIICLVLITNISFRSVSYFYSGTEFGEMSVLLCSKRCRKQNCLKYRYSICIFASMFAGEDKLSMLIIYHTYHGLSSNFPLFLLKIY